MRVFSKRVAVAVCSLSLLAGSAATPPAGAALLPPPLGEVLGPLLPGVDLDGILEDVIGSLPLPDLSALPDLDPAAAPALPLPDAGLLPLLPDLGPVLDPLLPLPPLVVPGLPPLPGLPALDGLPAPLPELLAALFVDVTVDEVVADGSTVTTTSRLALLLPSTIDTDGDPLDGGELLALATIGSDGITLHLEQLAGAGPGYRARAVGTITDPTDPTRRYELGFDGRDSGFPRAVDLAAVPIGGGGAVTLRTVEPAPAGALVATLVEGGAPTASGRAGLTPVPATTVVGLAGKRVSIEVSEPTVLDLAVDAGATHLDARIDRLPSNLTLERGATADGSTVLSLGASDRIASVLLDVVDGSTAAHLDLADVPTAVTVSRSSGGARVDAPGRIGLLDLAIADGGAAPTLPDAAYVRITDTGVAARVPGLVEAAATTAGGPTRVLLRADPVPFRGVVEQGARSVDVRVVDLPAVLDIAVDPTGAVALRNSAPVASL